MPVIIECINLKYAVCVCERGLFIDHLQIVKSKYWKNLETLMSCTSHLSGNNIDYSQN